MDMRGGLAASPITITIQFVTNYFEFRTVLTFVSNLTRVFDSLVVLRENDCPSIQSVTAKNFFFVFQFEFFVYMFLPCNNKIKGKKAQLKYKILYLRINM